MTSLLTGSVLPIPDGVRGFDTTAPLTSLRAAAFVASGYRFAVRYVRRSQPHVFDITDSEASTLLAAGLGLMLVQHVESADAWTPTAAKGDANGDVAAQEAVNIGLPPGVTVWCDLEGVTRGTPSQQVIDYVNNWSIAVSDAGFIPGLYVGWRVGLDATQLYQALTLSHYWGSYNLDVDQEPLVRGLQMRQSARTARDGEFGVAYDVDTVQGDRLSGRPTMLAPSGWSGGILGSAGGSG